MSEPASHRLKQAKRALRKRILADRDALPPSERAAKSRAIAERLMRTSEGTRARTVMAFWSFGSEVDTAPVIDRLVADGRTIALPRIEQGDLVPVVYTPGEPMTRTSFGAMEPASGRALQPDELDLVVVPGVAFDRSGGRVGYGAGFYDRLLARAREDASTIAIAFALQVVDEVPRGRFDRPVDAVVTEGEVIRPRSLGDRRRS